MKLRALLVGFAVFLGILLASFHCAVSISGSSRILESAKSARKPSPYLQQLYAEYNESYFGGKLPDTARVYFGPAQGDLGSTYRCGNDFCVEINPSLNPDTKEQASTLLHECIHIKLWGREFGSGHGRLFLAELHRLMMEGAFDDLL